MVMLKALSKPGPVTCSSLDSALLMVTQLPVNKPKAGLVEFPKKTFVRTVQNPVGLIIR